MPCLSGILQFVKSKHVVVLVLRNVTAWSVGIFTKISSNMKEILIFICWYDFIAGRLSVWQTASQQSTNTSAVNLLTCRPKWAPRPNVCLNDREHAPATHHDIVILKIIRSDSFHVCIRATNLSFCWSYRIRFPEVDLFVLQFVIANHNQLYEMRHWLSAEMACDSNICNWFPVSFELSLELCVIGCASLVCIDNKSRKARLSNLLFKFYLYNILRKITMLEAFFT